jgi:MFS family permease
LQYGKRPVYLLSLLGTIATQIWTPFVTTNSHWILSKVLQGFFGAPIESLCQISIADVHFQHNRGWYIGLYTLSLGGSSTLAPFFAGLVSEKQTWKWVPYLASILCAFSFVVCLLSMEETNYDRTGNAERIFEHEPSRAGVDLHSEGELRIKVSEVDARSSPSFASVHLFLDRLRIFRTRTFQQKNQFQHLARRTLTPIFFLRFPIVAYAGVLYGSHLVWTNLLNGTVAYVLSQPPYDFRPSSIGLSYLAAFFGVLCGCLYTGWFGDKFGMWMAKRNHGIYEPEQRLWLLAPSVVSVPCGLALWGVGECLPSL